MPSGDQKNEGGCLCGAIRYRISGRPSSAALCHCTSCRRASGAPSVAWITVKRSQLEMLAGSPMAFHSSPPVTRQFCGRCGSALTYETTKSPDSIDITTASLDDPNAFPPTADVWLEDKLAWQPTDPSTGKFLGSSSD
jgi:hypothetical protein